MQAITTMTTRPTPSEVFYLPSSKGLSDRAVRVCLKLRWSRVGFPFRVATWAGLSAVAILNHFPQNETTEQWLKTNLTGLSSMLAFGAWCGECNLSQGLLKKEKVA